MPWAERSIVKLRKEFILRALARDVPFRELCREFSISRKTGYKWLDRVVANCELADRSSRPHTARARCRSYQPS